MSLEETIEKWRVIPYCKAPASWHMAVDESLFNSYSKRLKEGEPIKPTLRVYGFTRPAIIFGCNQEFNGVDVELLKSISGEYTTRITGGGHIYFTPQELHFSLIRPNTGGIYAKPRDYRENNIPIANALKKAGVDAEVGNTSIKFNGKTLVVSAQRRCKDMLLHHGTILANLDLDFFGRVLGASEQEKSVFNTITYLSDIDPSYQQTINILKDLLLDCVTKQNYEISNLDSEELADAEMLHKEKYSNDSYLKSGTKKAGVCIVAGVIQNYEEYIQNNTAVDNS